MYTITKEFAFSASHQLLGLPEDHQCARLHGHNYVVELELAAGVLNDVGFVVDYGELAPFKRYLDHVLDHRHLNDVLGFNPTAELLARHLYYVALEHWPEVRAVRVRETPKTCSEFRP